VFGVVIGITGRVLADEDGRDDGGVVEDCWDGDDDTSLAFVATVFGCGDTAGATWW
jgi:hypothetical protein